MKKYITFGFIIALLAVSSVSQPTFATVSVGEECIKLTTTLRIGHRDIRYSDPTIYVTPGQVYTLQQFLRAQGYLYAQPTGYFGTATRRSLINFQRANGLPQTGTTNGVTRNKIQTITCGGGSTSNLPIRIISPVGGEQINLGSNIQLTIENASYITPSNANGGYGMYYVVDLVNTYGVVQNLGVMYINSPSSRQTASYQVSGSLPVGSDYRVLVTPSCFTSTTQPRCQVVSSNTFSIGRATPSGVVRITNPNGGETISAGTNFRLQGTIPSDRRYEVSYYLIPQSGTPIRIDNGSFYDPVSGGYNIGGHNSNDVSTSIDHTVYMPVDIPAGTYKLRVFLTVAGTPRPDSHTPSNTFAYDDSDGVFTVTSTNTNKIIRVITPNGGERLEINKEHRIEWASPGISLSERVNITATLEQNLPVCPTCRYDPPPVYIIATNVLNQGYYYWNINASTLSQTYGGRPLTAGKYKIRITIADSNITDTSDNFFDVISSTTNNPVSVDISSPQTGEYWPLYTTQRIRFSLANIPNGAVAAVTLRDSSGYVGALKTIPVPATGVIDVYLDQIIKGDVVDNIRPGQYIVALDIYDRAPCFGLCSPDYIRAQKIATDSTGYITIY